MNDTLLKAGLKAAEVLAASPQSDMAAKKTPTESVPNSSEPEYIVPERILELLGAPPILDSENLDHYRKFQLQFALEYQPKTMTEWLLVNDLVDINWEIQRYRRVKAVIPKAAGPSTFQKVIGKPVPDGQKAIALISGQKTSDAGANQPSVAETDFYVPAYITAELIDGIAIVDNLQSVEQLERLIERAEIRREKITQEFSAHRALFVSDFGRKSQATVEREEFLARYSQGFKVRVGGEIGRQG
ncbi:hypothetical protein [Mesorhizobium sp. 10J20-29]